jgi:tryptophan halogenase
MPNLKNIVIVGAGSSAWMTAATLKEYYPSYNVTVIESPDIPTIGVGESTQQLLFSWMDSIGVDYKDFMSYTDASYKLSIKFRNFHEKKDAGFHYPFGALFTGNSSYDLQDWYLKKIKYPETPITEFYDSFWPMMTLIKDSKISTNKTKALPNFDFKNNIALHFDATKFASWLKEKFSIPRGVNLISANVTEIKNNESGIEYLTLSNGDTITADLYIDCTGFKSLLISSVEDSKFLSYSDRLPCNKAWAIQMPYVDIEKELENYTNCTALGYGWVWNIPLYSRVGTGYVYSDRFTTKEEALEEYKNYLMSDQMVVPRTKEQVDEIEFRDVTFRTGRQEKVWNKNVVSIGLSAGFIEPLESNGLHTTHEFLKVLSKYISRGFYNQTDIDQFNIIASNIYDGFFDFVEMHYVLSKRDDTDFWKYMTSKPNDISKTMSSLYQVSQDRSQMLSAYQKDRTGLVSILTGHNIFPLGPESLKIWNAVVPQDVDTTIAGFDFKTKREMKNWQEEADGSPTHYEYLKNNFHS